MSKYVVISHDRWTDLKTWDDASGKLASYRPSPDEATAERGRCSTQQYPVPVVMYLGEDGRLWLSLGTSMKFDMGEISDVDQRMLDAQHAELTFTYAGAQQRIEYRNPVTDWEGSINFEEPDDFDFFLYLGNVLREGRVPTCVNHYARGRMFK